MPKDPIPLENWVKHARSLVRRQYDNIMLFTGPEGEGKSKTAIVVLKKLDPGFGPHRFRRGIRDFLAHSVPPTGITFAERKDNGEEGDYAELVDEIEANKRRAMSRLTVDLLDHLKESRGMGKHVALCYPAVDLFEGAILDHRIRFRFHTPKRGTFTLLERRMKEATDKDGNLMFIPMWFEWGTYTIPEPTGPLIRAYDEWKREGLRSIRDRYAPTETRAVGSAGVVDHARAVGFFATALRDLQVTRVGASIHETP